MAKMHLKKLPNVIIHLRCSKDASLQRFRMQQTENIEGGQTEADYERRMNEYES